MEVRRDISFMFNVEKDHPDRRKHLKLMHKLSLGKLVLYLYSFTFLITLLKVCFGAIHTISEYWMMIGDRFILTLGKIQKQRFLEGWRDCPRGRVLASHMVPRFQKLTR